MDFSTKKQLNKRILIPLARTKGLLNRYISTVQKSSLDRQKYLKKTLENDYQ